MVGDPKYLTDLHRIQARLRVTCRACGNVREFGVDELWRELFRRRRNTAWELLPGYLRCRCGAKGPRLLILPFAER